MKYILFSNEVICVPDSITFWIMDRGDEYSAPYCVNMSPLEPQNFMGEPNVESIIRSEGYKEIEEARARLQELLELLNK